MIETWAYAVRVSDVCIALVLTISCIDNIRLVDGTDASNGRIEVYHNDQWGVVCNNRFGYLDADVACRQLGYASVATIHDDAPFGCGYLDFIMDELQCSGNENQIQMCISRGLDTSFSCQSGDVASVCECTHIPLCTSEFKHTSAPLSLSNANTAY